MIEIPEWKIDTAKKTLTHVYSAAAACERTDFPFPQACVLLSHESGGKNVYGRDKGGLFSTNGTSVTLHGKTYKPSSLVPVKAENFGLFLLDIEKPNVISNGVGPCQITYKPYFRMMLERGLRPWQPVDNMTFGFEIFLANYLNTGSWLQAAGLYNGGTKWKEKPTAVDYANRFVIDLRKWRKKLRDAQPTV